MKIATFNVNGIKTRLPNLLEWLERERPDVACLQELKALDGAFPQAALREAGYESVWKGQRSWNGVAILGRGVQPLEIRRELPGEPGDGCALPSRQSVAGRPRRVAARAPRRSSAAARCAARNASAICCACVWIMRRRSSCSWVTRIAGVVSSSSAASHTLRAMRTSSSVTITRSSWSSIAVPLLQWSDEGEERAAGRRIRVAPQDNPVGGRRFRGVDPPPPDRELHAAGLRLAA